MTDANATRTHTIGPVSLTYRLTGHPDGEPLICIHGVGSYLEAWDETADLLADLFSILTLDLRGHGRSSLAPGPYDIEDFIGDVLGLADHIGFERFHLAGFSLGGLIAQGVTLAHPERVLSLTLLSTVAGRNPAEQRRVRQRLAALQKTTPNAHHDASLARWVTEAFQERRPERIAELRRRDAENDPACYAAAYHVLAETDYGPVLDRIRTPTLIVTGAEDEGSTPRMARFMSDRIAGARLRILPQLRHCLLIEAPALVAKEMLEFLTSLGTQACEAEDKGAAHG